MAHVKTFDIGGFAAIIGAGFLIGRDTERQSFPTQDLFAIAALFVLGWYLAVTLS